MGPTKLMYADGRPVPDGPTVTTDHVVDRFTIAGVPDMDWLRDAIQTKHEVVKLWREDGLCNILVRSSSGVIDITLGQIINRHGTFAAAICHIDRVIVAM